jgi:hypothetical protein
LVEFKESLKVDENSLCCLWPKKGTQVTGWPNCGGKHKIEGDRLGQLVASERRLELIFLDGGLHVVTAHSIQLHQHRFQSFLYIRRGFLVLKIKISLF